MRTGLKSRGRNYRSAAAKVLGASLISGLFLFLQRRIIIGMSRNIEFDMRQKLYAHLVDQPLSFFHEHRTGDLMARATNDLSAVRQLAGPVIMYTLQTVFVVILVLPLMFMLNWWLTLLLFVTMPLVSLTVKFFGQQVHTRFEKIQGFFGEITARAQENFSGVRVVRAYAQEEAEMNAFNTLNREYADRNLGLVRVEALMRPLMTFLIGFGYVLIIWAGVPLAVRGEISCRRVHDVQPLSRATNLAAHRARLRRESLPARNGELETAQCDFADRAGDCRHA